MNAAKFTLTEIVHWQGQSGIVTQVLAAGAEVRVLFLDGKTRAFTRRPLYHNDYMLHGESYSDRLGKGAA
jgi:hypothetical protein